MKKLFVFISLLCFCLASHADSKTDSLISALRGAKDDTLKVNLLLTIGNSLRNSDPQQTITFGMQGKELSERLNYTKGLALSYKTIAMGYFNKSLYIKALQNNEQSLALFDSIGDKKGVANIYSNMGNIYYQNADDPQALNLYLKSLKISEELNDTLRIVTALSNIGNVYLNKRATYGQALEYFLRAYPMSVALNDNYSIAAISVNIGESYFKLNEIDFRQSNNDSALAYYKISLKASESTDNEPYTLNDIGNLYLKEKEYDKAITYHTLGYEKASKLDAKYDMAISLKGLGQALQGKGDLKKALTTFKEAEKLATETKSNYELKDIYIGLAMIYGDFSDMKNAFKYQNLLIAIKDSIYNIETDKKLGGLQFAFDITKKESQINLLTKDQELKAKEISRQKIVRNSFIGGFAIVLLFAGVFFTQRNRISKEKKRSDELLLNILPSETAEELKATGSAKAKSFDLASVLFTDFKNFTQASEKLTPEELVAEINHCYSEFDKIITNHGLEKIKTIGDAYMCAGGLPVTNTTHPVDIVAAGLEMVKFIEKNKQERLAKDQPFFELRCGIHTGPVVAGIVGIKKFAYDIWGDTVNTASRMESSGEIGKVNISGATYELVKDKFKCAYRGKVKAKNKGEIDMYFVEEV